MKNSALILDVNQKENVQIIASLNTATNTIKLNKLAIDQKVAGAANAMHGAGTALAALPAEVQGKRVTLIVPDSIAVRCFEMLKYRDQSEDEIAGMLYKPWMSKDASAEAYAEAIALMVKGFKSAMAKNISVNFVNARTIYRYELVGDAENIAALVDMDTIDLVNSVNTDLGIKVRDGEFSFANGTYKILKQTRRGANGSNTHYYISRMLSAIVDGKRVQLPVGQAAGMPVDAVKPVNDNGITLLNVARFRAEAAKALPRKEIVTSFKVVEA